MVMGRWNYLILICSLMTLAICGCENKEPAREVKTDLPVNTSDVESSPELSVQSTDVESPLEGCWRSVKMEGADIGSFMKEIRYTFGNDGSFVAEAAMADGSTDKNEGTYRVEGNELFRLIKGASLKGEFAFENEKLMIYDPFLDTKIWFEKQLQKF